MTRQPRSDDEILSYIDIDKFWSNVHQCRDHECWIWKGSIDTQYGYGIIPVILRDSHTQFQIRAHRVAYILGTGQPLGALHALHHCDNPPCCNYRQHLFAGTHQDNMRDKCSKGRADGGKKLTTQAVAEIRRQYGNGARSADLAEVFNADRRQIERIANGTSRARDPSPVIVPNWRASGLRRIDGKLTDTDVIMIRQAYIEGNTTQKALAELYGVSNSYICRIVARQNRKDIG